eukprot:2365164-Prymnesium_polylepis.3
MVHEHDEIGGGLIGHGALTLFTQVQLKRSVPQALLPPLEVHDAARSVGSMVASHASRVSVAPLPTERSPGEMAVCRGAYDCDTLMAAYPQRSGIASIHARTWISYRTLALRVRPLRMRKELPDANERSMAAGCEFATEGTAAVLFQSSTTLGEKPEKQSAKLARAEMRIERVGLKSSSAGASITTVGMGPAAREIVRKETGPALPMKLVTTAANSKILPPPTTLESSCTL